MNELSPDERQRLIESGWQVAMDARQRRAELQIAPDLPVYEDVGWRLGELVVQEIQNGCPIELVWQMAYMSLAVERGWVQ